MATATRPSPSKPMLRGGRWCIAWMDNTPTVTTPIASTVCGMSLGRPTIWMRTSISSSGTQARVVLRESEAGGERMAAMRWSTARRSPVRSPGSWWSMKWGTPSACATMTATVRISCRKLSYNGIGSPRALPNSCPCIPTSIPRPRLKRGRRPPSNSSRRLDIQPCKYPASGASCPDGRDSPGLGRGQDNCANGLEARPKVAV